MSLAMFQTTHGFLQSLHSANIHGADSANTERHWQNIPHVSRSSVMGEKRKRGREGERESEKEREREREHHIEIVDNSVKEIPYYP